MPRTRPPYAEEFRREAVALIRSGQRTLPEVSMSLGVSQQTLACATSVGGAASASWAGFRTVRLSISHGRVGSAP
jgi:transposase-like protein